MQIQEIRDIAKAIGIKTGKLSKLNLIQEIQRAEGNFDCFASATQGECSQNDCCWRSDCFTMAQKPALVSVV
ncbi:hypothetical protein MNBD_GAMMA22-2463 [hydrothermal vent metagenome]|uniref:Uncharacterized protein n=1 Tax=hydrothermal vent metagenome TaxID=652676 RepID=A0A3B1AFT9_9ZZZZ